jgi:Flp pilus assembly protein, protease CpaA
MDNLMQFINGIKSETLMVFDNKVLLGVLIAFLIGATITDVRKMKIYDWFNGLFLAVRIAFIFIPVYSLKFELTHLIGGVVGFMFLLIPAMALMHKMAGDIKFMAVLGMFLGGHLTIVFLLIACLYNLLYAMTSVYVLKRAKSSVLIPFAPFFLLSFTTITALTMVLL